MEGLDIAMEEMEGGLLWQHNHYYDCSDIKILKEVSYGQAKLSNK